MVSTVPSPEALLAAFDRLDLRLLQRDVEPRLDDKWGVVDTSTADPDTNWPGDLISEHETYGEARTAMFREMLRLANAALGGSAWRPIAEARHDGTVYLLGFYDSPEKTEESWCAVEGWYESGMVDKCWYTVFHDEITPTHFQERSAPPPVRQEP